MKLKILLVDDEPKVLRGLRAIIDRADENWEIIGECRNGVEALDVIKGNCPDVVISDIKMPCMSGLELVEKVKNSFPDMKFIILSGYADFNFAQQAIRLDTVDYILKPPDFKDILNSIRKVELHKKQLEARIKEGEELQRLKRETLVQAREKFFRQILYKTESCAEGQELKALQEYEIFFQKYALLLFKLDNFSFFVFENTDDKLKRLARFREEVRGAVYNRNGCIADLYDGTYCCLVNVNNENTVYLKGFAGEIRDELVHKLDENITVGVSRAYSGPENASTAYKECLIILRNKIFFKRNSIIHVQDVKTDPNSESYPFELEHKYIESLKFANLERSTDILKNLIDRARSISNRDPVLFKSIIMEFIIAVSRSLSEDEYLDMSSVLSGKSIFNRLNLLDNMDDINMLLLEFTESIIGYFNNRNKHGCRKIINDLKQYIQNNYFKDISLRQAANEYFMNESYLSDLFKREAGVSFTNYLTKVRMEKARVLLKQMDLKTHDISEMVGYNNSRYFNKLFKKYTGFTPFEYRERVLNHEK